jgi:uncharacterized protein YlzI (FlbEa/FlbD family)
MDPVILAALYLIRLHDPNGNEVDINPREITVMREKQQGQHLTAEAECAISLSDGKFVSVRETCDQVRQKIDALEKAR